jgi:hypothetical protein
MKRRTPDPVGSEELKDAIMAMIVETEMHEHIIAYWRQASVELIEQLERDIEMEKRKKHVYAKAQPPEAGRPNYLPPHFRGTCRDYPSRKRDPEWWVTYGLEDT